MLHGYDTIFMMVIISIASSEVLHNRAHRGKSRGKHTKTITLKEAGDSEAEKKSIIESFSVFGAHSRNRDTECSYTL